MNVQPTLNPTNLPNQPDSKSNTTGYGFLIRLYTYVAHFAIVFTAIVTVTKHVENLPLRIIVCSSIGILALILRFIDIRYLGGADSNGKPLTVKDWALYARNMLILTILAVLAMIIFR